MKSPNPNTVGVVACPECGGPCDVREHRKGKFLYKHCQDEKECRYHADSRGPKTQARWRAEIAEDADFAPVVPDLSDPIKPEPDVYVPGQPDPVITQSETESEPDATGKGSTFKTVAMVTLGIISAGLGIKGVQLWKQRN